MRIVAQHARTSHSKRFHFDDPWFRFCLAERDRRLGAREILPPGFRPQPVGVHALVGGKVVTKPGETLDGATIVIRDGYIEAVGKDVSFPADARVWDMKGLTIYAGFIESYLPLGQTNQPISTSDTEPVSQHR